VVRMKIYVLMYPDILNKTFDNLCHLLLRSLMWGLDEECFSM